MLQGLYIPLISLSQELGSFTFASARIYFLRSSQASRISKTWRSDLEAKKKPKLAALIADPEENPEAFSEGWEETLEREKQIASGASSAPSAAEPTPTTNGAESC